MAGSGDHFGSTSVSGAEFQTTHWNVVLAARQHDAAGSEQALSELCQTYWFPLYAYVRRHGHERAEAQDLTQEFFARLLDKDSLQGLDPAKGRFRCFVLGALKHFLANEWRRDRTARRGGAVTFVSWEAENAENQYLAEVPEASLPETVYDQAWALALLRRVHETLRGEYVRSGSGALFEVLEVHLSGGNGGPTYAEAAAKLKMTEAAVKMAVLRLRHRYRDLLRAEITRTVASAGEVDEEIRYLFAAANA